METSVQKHIVAVIDIGTSAIRMVVAEVGPKTAIRYLENLQKPVRLGKDVFTIGRIGNQAMREAVEVLKNYKVVAESYGTKKIHTIATSAVREALNRDTFVDQVYVRTGIEMEIIEGPEENRLELMAVEYAFEDKIVLEAKNCLIVEVGSGSTEMIILNQGQVEITRTLSLGAMRLPDQVKAGKTALPTLQRALKRNIHETVLYAAREYNVEQVDTFVALGGDMRFVAQQLNEKIEERFVEIENRAFSNFVGRVSKMTTEEIVAQYAVSYEQAETLCPTLLIYQNFLSETKAQSILVPMCSIRDALLVEQAQFLSGHRRTDLSKQVINSARHLGDKYRYDKNHAANVTVLALKLFDALRQDHGMGGKERLLLEVSALLHDIGTFVSPSGHHKHSGYLVNASEIFGLRRVDRNIVANVVRYHRRTPPKVTHELYMSLSRFDRATVSKLAAILRVADAMDHSHQQKIKTLSMELDGDTYVLWVPSDAGDIALERDALSEKGDMFAEVYGAPIVMKLQPLAH